MAVVVVMVTHVFMRVVRRMGSMSSNRAGSALSSIADGTADNMYDDVYDENKRITNIRRVR